MSLQHPTISFTKYVNAHVNTNIQDHVSGVAYIIGNLAGATASADAHGSDTLTNTNTQTSTWNYGSSSASESDSATGGHFAYLMF